MTNPQAAAQRRGAERAKGVRSLLTEAMGLAEAQGKLLGALRPVLLAGSHRALFDRADEERADLRRRVKELNG